jgi:hypothetical protein
MARVRGISEKIVYAFNPLPDVSDASLYKAAKLPLIEPAKISPFVVTWKYGGTLEDETVHLQPGDFLGLRESEGQEFLRDKSEVGCVLVDDPTDEEQVKEARRKGLIVAQKFYAERGHKRIFEWRKNHGVSKDEMEDHRYDLWVYYYNQAKADLIAKELKKD